MKKLLLCAFLFVALNTHAQITVDSGDMPQTGQTYAVSNGDLLNGYDFTETGADYTWDYSGLGMTQQNTQNYIAVSDAPFSYQFLFNNPFDPDHIADYALNTEGFSAGQISFEEFFIFSQNDNDANTVVGYGASINGIPVPSVTEPVDDVFLFPLEYQDTNNSYSEWAVSVPGIGSYELEQDRSYEVEGYGTVITPGGTYEALKVRMEIESEDSVYIDLIGQGLTFQRSTIEYHWIAKTEGIPVLKVTEAFGQTATIEYKDVMIPDNVAQNDTEKVEIYPTLTRDQVNIKGLDSASKIRVFNASGALIMDEQGVNTLNLAGNESGYYIVRVERNGALFTEVVLLVP